jgi:hypothetical protein
MSSLKKKVEALSLGSRLTVPITTFGSTSYVVRREIPCTIRRTEDEYIASFFDAGISISGDTEEEAFLNLRDLITDMLQFLEAQPPESLGPDPKRQLQVLREFIQVH